ncbi:MAG TPA: hypothetical protein VFL90_20280 [Methylomirabilota bacterium]|nr:hypothetical protein [Methylomirabilota bacterium]
MTLGLTEIESEELRNALTSYLGDLRMEIGATDAWESRQALKQRRDVLTGLLARAQR